MPGPDYVPPYGSVYRDGPNGPPGTWQGRPTLWGPSSVAVAQAYREAGLALAPGGPQVPDHIGLELQFMQHLCACEAGALSRGRTMQPQPGGRGRLPSCAITCSPGRLPFAPGWILRASISSIG